MRTTAANWKLLCILILGLVWGTQSRISAAAITAVGTIVYEHAPDDRGPWPVLDIYSVSADGKNPKALTSDGHSHSPKWSPNGQRILYIHDAALPRPSPYREHDEYASHHAIELYVMNRDGSNPHLLRRLDHEIFAVAWAPDGKTLAVEEPSVVLLDADGHAGPRPLIQDAFTPAWSPNGKKLALLKRLPNSRLAVYTANADGSNEIQLTDPSTDAGSPAWSPDGKQIAYDAFTHDHRHQEVFVMNEDGSGPHQITRSVKWDCKHPTWSSDGDRIAFFCRSVQAPCAAAVGGSNGSSRGCVRRIFVLSINDPKAVPIQVVDHDGAFPEFAPR